MAEVARQLRPGRPCDLLKTGRPSRLARLVQVAARINSDLVGCAVELAEWIGLNLGPVAPWPGARALRLAVDREPEFWRHYFRGLRVGYFESLTKPGAASDLKRAVGWVTASLAAAHGVGIETQACPWVDYLGDLADLREEALEELQAEAQAVRGQIDRANLAALAQVKPKIEAEYGRLLLEALDVFRAWEKGAVAVAWAGQAHLKPPSDYALKEALRSGYGPYWLGV